METTASPPADDVRGTEEHQPSRAWWKGLAFKNVSLLYVWALIIVLFALWIPDTFLSDSTWRSILTGQAIVAIMAMGVVVSLSAGAFDLAVGVNMGFSSIVGAWAMAHWHWSIPAAIALAILTSTGVGCVNAFLVSVVKIDTFIATIGVTSVLGGLVIAVPDNQDIVGLPLGFQDLALNRFLGLEYPVWVMLIVALVLWYLLEYTPFGRYLYATGGSPEAARLAGLRTRWMVALSLIITGACTGIAGVLLTAQIGGSSPGLGPPYLFPVFAAAFLGSTQVKVGRFNIWGTVLAVFVLATGIKGLQLAGAPFWISDVFNGTALLIAVALSRIERRRKLKTD
jgi:ribose transport system permease protein